ncbi:MAG: hypothetical protein J3K34DRAFT_211741 [Monoraphidium minutum]|nr:MAG: hypothetical protein J3K34DRAFT_211741 [Monoraphidium minutum]
MRLLVLGSVILLLLGAAAAADGGPGDPLDAAPLGELVTTAVTSDYSPFAVSIFAAKPLTHVPPGGAVEFTVVIANLYSNETTPKATIQVFANANASVDVCNGPQGDKTLGLPPITPMGIRQIKVSLKAPEAEGQYAARVVVDSACKGGPKVVGDPRSYAVNATLPPRLSGIALQFSGDAAHVHIATRPRYAAVNDTFDLTAGFVNSGVFDLEKGTKVVAWAAYTDAYLDHRPACAGIAALPGAVAAELSALKAGAGAAAVFKGLKAAVLGNPAAAYLPAIGVYWCASGAGVRPQEAAAWAPLKATKAPAALVGAWEDPAKPPATYADGGVSASPRAPRAGGKMSVKVKAWNLGSVEGSPNTGGLWLVPYDSTRGPAGWDLGLPVIDDRCNLTSEAAAGAASATSDFSRVKLRPGQSKTLAFRGVPAPPKAGWWVALAYFDLGCSNPGILAPGDYPLHPLPAAWNVFEVKA